MIISYRYTIHCLYLMSRRFIKMKGMNVYSYEYMDLGYECYNRCLVDRIYKIRAVMFGKNN